MEIPGSYAEEELLRDIKKGTNLNDVIRYLYRDSFHRTAIYIKQNSGNQEDAEDVFQEAIVSFIQLVQRDKFRGDCSIGTFIYTLVRHSWLNELKKKDRARIREKNYESGKNIEEPDVSEYIINMESKSAIVKLILEGLGETCKKILIAFYYENLSIQEILVSLDYENEQVVRNKKYKCLQKLPRESCIKSRPC